MCEYGVNIFLKLFYRLSFFILFTELVNNWMIRFDYWLFVPKIYWLHHDNDWNCIQSNRKNQNQWQMFECIEFESEYYNSNR